MTKTRQTKSSRAKLYKKNKTLRKKGKYFSKKQRGGFIKHPAVTNPLYGALWYSPTSLSQLLPNVYAS